MREEDEDHSPDQQPSEWRPFVSPKDRDAAALGADARADMGQTAFPVASL